MNLGKYTLNGIRQIRNTPTAENKIILIHWIILENNFLHNLVSFHNKSKHIDYA